MADLPNPTAFSFLVSFVSEDAKFAELAFQEVSGLDSGQMAESQPGGGENRFVHDLPKQAKKPNLKFKRAQTGKNGAMVNWCRSSIEGNLALQIEAKDLTISLLDAEGTLVARWLAKRAFPIKWNLGAFDAMKNELVIETVEFGYDQIAREI